MMQAARRGATRSTRSSLGAARRRLCTTSAKPEPAPRGDARRADAPSANEAKSVVDRRLEKLKLPRSSPNPTAPPRPRGEAPTPAAVDDFVQGVKQQRLGAEIKGLNIKIRLKELNLNMTDAEIGAAVAAMPRATGEEAGRITEDVYREWIASFQRAKEERAALVTFVAKSDEKSLAQRVLAAFDWVGVMTYASLGTIIAGEAGMNIVGSCLVGCVAAMGGGTLNNLLMGQVPVFWIRQPRYLAVCLAASAATFFTWPVLEMHVEKQAMQELDQDSDGNVSYTEFARWFDEREEYTGARKELAHRLELAVHRKLKCEPTTEQAFDFCNGNQGLGVALTKEDVRKLADIGALDSRLVYALDSVSLSAFAIVGAQHGITLGMPPLVCAAGGVSVCFGGILRDLLCRRDVALGAESFALATGAGATAYVGLRQLSVSGRVGVIPLGVRMAAGVSTVLGVRALAWWNAPAPLVGDGRTLVRKWLAPEFIENVLHTKPDAARAMRRAGS